MLAIALKNDLTGTEEKSNYDVVVMENDKMLWRGRVEGHVRKEGWEALVFVLAEEIYKKKLESQNAAGEFC